MANVDIPGYFSWVGMKQRCTNKKGKQYKDYGGRGISYCPRWESFDNFIEDMGTRPEGFTLDRVDNDQGYNPENCVWSSWKDQSLNKRMNSRNVSGVKGVSKHSKVDMWDARIVVDYKTHYLGLFRTLEEAKEARLQAEIDLGRVY